jgi:hypothetical protein
MGKALHAYTFQMQSCSWHTVTNCRVQKFYWEANSGQVGNIISAFYEIRRFIITLTYHANGPSEPRESNQHPNTIFKTHLNILSSTSGSPKLSLTLRFSDRENSTNYTTFKDYAGLPTEAAYCRMRRYDNCWLWEEAITQGSTNPPICSLRDGRWVKKFHFLRQHSLPLSLSLSCNFSADVEQQICNWPGYKGLL